MTPRPSGHDDAHRVDGSARRVAELAFPALLVLAAEPLYLLYDTAIVGRLGAGALAGLAIGGVMLTQVTTQLTFLSYGTTARAARLYGAGRPRDAVGEGVQATWLAVFIGVAVIALGQVVVGPVARALAGDETIAQSATSWFRIAVFGAPFVLISLAGNGWMRGVQDTRTPVRFVVSGLALSAVVGPVLVFGLFGAPELGLEGSAVANVVGQAVAGGLFVVALVRARVQLRPRGAILRAQVVLARDLVTRSLAFQICFLSAAAVAARFGAASVAAHQVVLQLWNFTALVLDSLAIAAQTLVGAALGARAPRAARTLAGRVTVYSIAVAAGLAALFALGAGVLPHVFTDDPAVLDAIAVPWWFFVALLPIAGVVFALDGVLLGAGDAAYLRTTTLGAALVGFLPFIWLSLAFDWGLAGIWTGLALFMVLRAVAVATRTVSGRWQVTGAERARGSAAPPGRDDESSDRETSDRETPDDR